ncbi:MAG: hypothetical protein AB9883_04485 [Acidaminococcaceae bacterium]
MSVPSYEIARDLVLAAIQKGHLDIVDDNSTKESIRNCYINNICNAYKTIHMAIIEAEVEESDYLNRR